MMESRTWKTDKSQPPDFSLQLLDHFLEGCQLLSPDWRYLYVNEAAATQGKQSREELLGKTMMEVYPGIENTPMFATLRRCMEERIHQKMENEFTFPDGSKGWFELRFEPVQDGVFILSYNISEQKRIDNELSMSVEFLELINAAESKEDLLHSILSGLKKWSGCEAISIRLREGPDFPYFVTTGFSADFVEKERHLCQYDKTGKAVCDENGKPILECMCGNIIRGRYDPSKNFFTSDGCFWSNCTTHLLATTTDADRQARTRNRCNSVGYESVALIPLRSGQETLGLIQLNDKQQGRFTPELIGQFRRVADQVASYLAKKLAEEALLKSEQRFRLMAETIHDVFWVSTRGVGKIIYISPAYEDLWERSRESLYSSPQSFMEAVHPEDVENFHRIVDTFHSSGQPYECEYRIIRKNGEVRWILERGFPISDTVYEDPLMTGICTDITAWKQQEEEKRQLQRQFEQAQKLESIGRLAGGVAHDYNNILSVQLGYCDLMLEELRKEDPFAQNLSQIKDSAMRGVALTRQLLAFSRKQPLQPEVMDLNAVMENIEKMLQRLIGEDIELAMVLRDNLGRVKVDPSQIEQVLMNLAVNARDAMPDGGKLTIETANVDLDDAYAAKHDGVKAGPYVLLAVSDSGCGMDKETKAQIFEPFFTTKGKGKGTGLGLATVYGIVKQSGGNIWVYSEVSQGTSFKIYLPRVNEELSQTVQKKTFPVAGKGELVLVVEDQSDLRILITRMIKSLGYKVISAQNGGEALIVVEEEHVTPDILVTDVVMPGMNGRVLAERLIQKYSALKVLFISGYTDNAIVHHGVLDTQVAFLQKPFTKSDLAVKICEVISGKFQL